MGPSTKHRISIHRITIHGILKSSKIEKKSRYYIQWLSNILILKKTFDIEKIYAFIVPCFQFSIDWNSMDEIRCFDRSTLTCHLYNQKKLTKLIFFSMQSISKKNYTNSIFVSCWEKNCVNFWIQGKLLIVNIEIKLW